MRICATWIGGIQGFSAQTEALAGDLGVEQVGLALDRVLAGARERFAQLRRVLHHLAIHAKALGDRGHVHVRAAEIVVHELPRSVPCGRLGTLLMTRLCGPP